MNHFFITPDQINENKLIITGSDIRHIKTVLRMKVGDEASFSDGISPSLYRGIMTEVNDEGISFDIIYIQDTNHELPSQVYLLQGLPKADKMESIIQKAVELGIYEIIPVKTARSIVRLDEKKAQTKLKRWQNISEAAAKQSKRQTIPIVHNIMNFDEAVRFISQMDIKIIPYELADDFEKTKKAIERIEPGQTIAILIGPEGGFTSQEINFAIEAGINPVTMGKRILRTETAAFVILSWIMYHLEE